MYRTYKSEVIDAKSETNPGNWPVPAFSGFSVGENEIKELETKTKH